MEMKDVLKRLAELDSKNPNRPEYKIKTEQVIPSSPGTMPKPSGSGPVMPSRPGTMPRPSGSGNVLPQKTEKIGQEIEFLRTMIKFDEDALEQHMDDYPDLKLRPASSSHVNFLRNRIAQNQARLQKLETVYQKKATPMLPGTQTKYNLQNPNINECGMSYGSSMMDRPSTPASINITAGSGSELSGMLKDIMSLAGMSKQEPISSPVATVEPDMDDGTTVMRSVMDKLNPKVDAPENEGFKGALGGAMLGGAALGPLGAIGGGLLGNELTKETDEPENEGLAGTMLGGAAGAALTRSPGGAIVGAHVGDEIENSIRSRFSKDSEDNLEEYSNTPKDPTNVPPIGRDAMLNKSMHNQDPAGHPQKGKRMNGTMPRAHADEMYESLMKEYKKFVG
jgi:outer membrane lipoprotein SlyB